MILNKSLGGDFWIFRVGQFTADLGYRAAHLGLIWWAVNQTKSATSVAMILIPHAIAIFIFKPALAPCGDRLERKSLVVVGNLCQSLIMAAMGAIALTDNLSLEIAAWIMIFLALAQSLSSAGANGLVAQLVTKELLVPANASVQFLNAVALIVGGVIGSLMIAMLGYASVFFVSAIGLGLASLCAYFIRSNTRPRSSGSELTAVAWLADFSEGFASVWRMKIILGVVVVFSAINLFLAPLPLILPHIVQSEGLSSMHLAFLHSSLGLGIICGALLLPYLLRVADQAYVAVASLLCMGLAFTVSGLHQHYGSLLLCMTLITVCSSSVNIIFYSRLMASLPDHYRSRISSILELTATAIAPIALTFGGVLIDWVGSRPVLVLTGAGLLALSPALIALPGYFSYFKVSPEAASNWINMTYPNAFKEK